MRVLGWSGPRHCDGGDLGSGQLNVFCYVVDAAIAEKVIVSDLEKHGLLDGAAIAQGLETKPKILWPHDFAGTFAIL